MTDPRPVHVVGDSKSNSKISKIFLLYAELRLANGGVGGSFLFFLGLFSNLIFYQVYQSSISVSLSGYQCRTFWSEFSRADLVV